MEKKKPDRRVKYTKMVIKDSFVQLLKQKPLSKITIKEICETAEINRATYYAHYTDQYDLLQQIENEIINDINQYLCQYDLLNYKDFPIDVLTKILDYIKTNSELFDLLLNFNGDLKFQQGIIKLIGHQHFSSPIDSNSPDSKHLKYIFHFLATGSVGVIQEWLNDGMKISTKEMAELIIQITTNGRSSFK
jgi:AcrR family transcriptional regulator